MVKHLRCSKPCAACNSNSKGGFKGAKTVARYNFFYCLFYFFSTPSSSFESLNLTKTA